jgi:gliding motility-associated lipoprotein GldD
MKNEKIHFDNYIFTVESVDKRRIKRIKITIIKQEESGSFHEGGKIIPAILWPFLMLFTLLFAACNEDYVPKPRGYYRIDLPGNAYQTFQNDCPFSFEYSKYAVAESYQGEQKENCWYNIQYPKFKATIHLSYSAISSKKDLETQLDNSRTLAYKHTVKADGIDELPITYSSRNVYGLLYDLSGNSASQSQFYLTDSTKHFVRCALYFNSSPNADSIAPVLNFISKDIDKMIETFTWK